MQVPMVKSPPREMIKPSLITLLGVGPGVAGLAFNFFPKKSPRPNTLSARNNASKGKLRIVLSRCWVSTERTELDVDSKLGVDSKLRKEGEMGRR